MTEQRKHAPSVVPRVRVRRTFQASAALLFRCFTEPEELVKWFGPGEVRCTSARIDLRVGGEYRFEFLSPDGDRSVVAGVYRAIDPPRRLCFSWVWELWQGRAPAETLVTVEIVPSGGGAELIITHECFPDTETREEHATGWEATLDCLEQILAIDGC